VEIVSDRWCATNAPAVTVCPLAPGTPRDSDPKTSRRATVLLPCFSNGTPTARTDARGRTPAATVRFPACTHGHAPGARCSLASASFGHAGLASPNVARVACPRGPLVPLPVPTCMPCVIPDLLLKHSDATLATYKKTNETFKTCT
jgi:hypothetical protein